jgi:hypothetical protein
VPLKLMDVDDPVSYAIYARANDFLDKPGWKRFKHIAKREKKFNAWSIRLKSGHTTRHLGISTDMKFLGQMNKPFTLTKDMVILMGRCYSTGAHPD